MAQIGCGGNASAVELHQLQCEADGASPGPDSGLPDEAVLALHRPPSLPVRTSSASSETGASNADSTARKLNKAARRAHTESGGRECER